MTRVVGKILKQAINLPAIDRAELVEEILMSFDFPEREKIDALWAKEAEKRLKLFHAGRIKAQSAKRVFSRLQRKK